MNTPSKGKTLPKKFFKTALYLFIFLAGILYVSSYLFIKSPFFKKYAEDFINSRSERPVEIGEISLSGFQKILIKDVIVGEADSDDTFMVLPRVDIGLSLLFLLDRRIDTINIKRPEIFFNFKKHKKPEITEIKLPPFFFKKISLEDGELTLKHENGRALNIRSINVSVKASDDKRAEIRAEGFLNVPLWGEKDNNKFTLNAEYNAETFVLKIKNTVLSSPLFGVMYAEGTLKNPASLNPGFDLKVSGEDIRLHEAGRFFSGENAELFNTLSAEIYADVALYLKGNLKEPVINMESNISSKGIKLNKIASLFPAFTIDKGLSVHGTGELKALFNVAISRETSSVSGKAKLNIFKAGFSSDDANVAGEGIDMDISAKFAFPIPFERVEFSANASASGFEILAGSFYGDFSKRDINFSIEGKYDRNVDSFYVYRSKTIIEDIGTVLISGEVLDIKESPRVTANVHLKELSNKNVYDLFIRDTFQEKFGFLSGLETGGMTSAELTVKGTPERINTSGEIRVDNMLITDKKKNLAVLGINLYLPVNLSYPEKTVPKDTAQYGSLKVKDISVKGIKIKDIEVQPSVWQNNLIFKEDILIPIFEGSINLKNMTYSNLLSTERTLGFAISIEDIDLEHLSGALNLPVFSGQLTGIIPQAEIIGGSFRTEGLIVLRLFGGEVIISNLSVLNILGPVPSFRTSVEIKDIDLGRMTSTFEFGRISGILQGHVKDLVITKGQAESFEALIETTKKQGISQTISVEALKKISILGSGSSVSILSSGIQQLFKQYRYAKMGFRGSLRNDKFLLLGIAAEGNREYIVKGGFIPPKVDVISYNRKVSFQEMVNRLNRIKTPEPARISPENDISH